MKNILTISLSKHLNGEPIADLIEDNWNKTNDATRAHFNNVGFDVDPNDVPKMLDDLRQKLHREAWNGVLVGWCSRGYPQRTELFEQIMRVCLDEARIQKDLRFIFNTGPENLMEPVLRNFPEERI